MLLMNAPSAEPMLFSLASTLSRFSGFFYQCYLIPLAMAIIVLSLDKKKPMPVWRIVLYTLCACLLAGGLYLLLGPSFPDFKALGSVSHLLLLLFIAAYAAFFSPMQPQVRVVVAAALVADINWAQSISTQVFMPTLSLALANALQFLMLLIALAVILVFLPSRSRRIPTAYWMSMLIIAFISAACLYSIRILESQNGIIPAGSVALSIALFAFFAINLLIYYLYYALVKSHRMATEMQTMQAKLEQDLEFYRRSEALTQEYRSLRHELKNHFSVMESLLREKRYDQLHQYFEEYSGKKRPQLEEFRCPNPLVSSVISHQMNTALSAGVQLDVIAAVPEVLGIADDDLCSLLSNLLDNGVEGCLRAGKSCVKATLHTDKNCLFITVTNPAPTDTLKKNPRLRSTKNNADAHGFGIPIIRQIVERYDGIVRFSEDEGWFTADAMLYMEGQ